MDPDEALRLLREAIEHARWMQEADTDAPQFCVVDNRTVTEIVERFEALDEWIKKGGFLPADWRPFMINPR